MAEFADVIVVGAGVSGLTAAYHILKKDPTLTVLVLEAQGKRVGGRLLSLPLQVDINGRLKCFDIGGQFICSTQFQLINFIKSLGLTVVENERKSGLAIIKIEEDKKETCANCLKYYQKSCCDLSEFISKIDEMSKDITLFHQDSLETLQELDSIDMSTFISENLETEFCRNLFKSIILNFFGLEPEEISVLYYLIFCNHTGGVYNQFLRVKGGARESWIKGGAQEICYQLSRKIGVENVKRDDAVIQISVKKNSVLIDTECSRYRCRFVIVAIPPQEVLNINFRPSLNERKKEILYNMSSCDVLKFVATYKNQFWKKSGLSGDLLCCEDTGDVYYCNDISDDKTAVLTGHVLTRGSFFPQRNFNSLPLKNEVLKRLSSFFGPEALQPLDYCEKLWWEAPFVGCGLVSCPQMGQLRYFNEIRQPFENRIYWAGTESATFWNGFIAGAVQAGLRASVEVLSNIRPQLIEIEDLLFFDLFMYENFVRRRNIKASHDEKWKTKVLISVGLILMLIASMNMNKKRQLLQIY